MKEAAYSLLSLMIVQIENEDYKGLEKTAKRISVIAQQAQVKNV